ncbi:hypothetical protein IQ07DRAFT_582976 [Pyrenochaeta sp. DS3sAY3a]|nr:hypothetical protein IQ07DRAFT_582976 [Pyrenochaeta sp. DS3sAY3a]
MDSRFSCRFYSGWGCKNHEQIGGNEGLKGKWPLGSGDPNPGRYKQGIAWSRSGTCWYTG